MAWLFLLLVFIATPSFSSDFGLNGIIKTPNARMREDAALTMTLSRERLVDIYSIAYQLTPRVESTFRYSVFNPRSLQNSSDDLKDRSYGIKVRIRGEDNIWPSMALGIRDVLGTGVWESEYLVLSKKINNIDFSVGIGWGRLGQNAPFDNPLAIISKDLKFRPGRDAVGGEFGGKSRGRSFFRGDAALFGSAMAAIPGTNFRLLAEYNSDTYTREQKFSSLPDPSPFNVGLTWDFGKKTNFTVSWLRGDQIGLRVSSSLETKNSPKKRGTARNFYSSLEDRSLSLAPAHLNLASWYDRLLFDLERGGVGLHSAIVSRDATRVSLTVENNAFQLTRDAYDYVKDLSRVHLPPETTELKVSFEKDGYSGPSLSESFSLEKHQDNSLRSKRDQIIIQRDRDTRTPTNLTDYEFPRLNTGADLSSRMQLMDPDAPLRSQLFLKLSSRLRLSRNFDVWGVWSQDLWNDFSNERKSNSSIQKVRSDVNEYLTSGESGLDQLFMEYRKTVLNDLHLRSYFGMLEMMYGGLGLEVLYSPVDSRLAFGATMNRLRQRAFDKKFRLMNYQTTTHYLSLFYASPFFNYDLGLHMGRYLAKDKGFTLEVRRSFKNGFAIGGFATKTDVSAEEFGEGSFDKGLFFRIPLGSLFGSKTRSAYSTIVRPLDRDGGRRLEDFSGVLWHELRDLRYDVFK